MKITRFLRAIRVNASALCLTGLLWCIFTMPALGQTAALKTANEYVKPYSETFQYGVNMGYFGSQWTDEKLAEILTEIGGRTIRPTLPDKFVEKWGYNVRLNAFKYYTNTLGMKEIACFVGEPAENHRDQTIYSGCTQPSQLFANLYQPIWENDGTVNQDNHYAYYIYRLVQTYGDYVRFWEVVNEPDFIASGNPANWLSRPPLPFETKTQAPFFHYIRMLRITWEVVKKYKPEDYVTTGGIGYPEYLDALLRYTDNPSGGGVTTQYPLKGGAYFDVLSYHVYPAYFLHGWDNAIGDFRYFRTSDYAAAQVIKQKKAMEDVLNKYGYDGYPYPKKHFICTETNISRRTSDSRYSSDEMQRNFGIKALVLAQKNNIKQLHLLGIAEAANAPSPSSSVPNSTSYALMGLFENLYRDAPGQEKLTQQGKGFATTTKLLAGYTYDASRTAAMNLPANVEGAAFVKNGKNVYVLWAKTLVDKSESASATYSFPASWNISSLNRYEWNHAASDDETKQSPNNISLTGSPSFFLPGTLSQDNITLPSTAAGYVYREQWSTSILGSLTDLLLDLASLPNPANVTKLTSLEASEKGTGYMSRIRGYIHPPVDGNYTFYVAGDDKVELWVSSDENPDNRKKVAYSESWTDKREWDKYPSQKSAAISLKAGRKYYVEVLHQEKWGSDNLSVGWSMPDNTTIGVIRGTYLSPYETVAGRIGTKNPEVELVSAATLTVSPNPVNEHSMVYFTPSQSGLATLHMYDLQGRLISELYKGAVKAGEEQRIPLRREQLNQNVYVIRLINGTQVSSQKVYLAK